MDFKNYPPSQKGDAVFSEAELDTLRDARHAPRLNIIGRLAVDSADTIMRAMEMPPSTARVMRAFSIGDGLEEQFEQAEITSAQENDAFQVAFRNTTTNTYNDMFTL